MFEGIKGLNPQIKLFDAEDREFAPFGRIIKCLDETKIIKAAKKIPTPDHGSLYVPSREDFESFRIAKRIENEFFGTLPTQIGYCWGRNNFLNAAEWHTSSEINIALTPLVLILGHIWDMENGCIDSSRFKAFYLPSGTVVEIYSTSLHFCPCQVQENGFGCIVCLPRGTNTDLPDGNRDPLLFRKNKWIVAHVDNRALIDRGVIPGITGTNLEIHY